MEVQVPDVSLGNLFDVLSVLFAEQYVCYPGTFGGKDFLLYASYGQNTSGEGYLAGHRRVLPHFPLCESRCERCGYRDTSRRSVFRCGAFRHVDVYVVVVEDSVVYAERVGMSLAVFQSQCSRFLHHVAQISGECQFCRLAF